MTHAPRRTGQPHAFVKGEQVPDDLLIDVTCKKCGDRTTMVGRELRGVVACQRCNFILGNFSTDGVML